MKYKYLIVFVDGEVKVTNQEPKQSDIDAWEDGIIEALINLEDYTIYNEGIWEPVAEFNS